MRTVVVHQEVSRRLIQMVLGFFLLNSVVEVVITITAVAGVELFSRSETHRLKIMTPTFVRSMLRASYRKG